jgi:hypothetical protein
MSLFAHLVSRFARSPENLATEALAYILQNSSTARLAFISHLREFAANLPDDLTFRTQETGDDNAIPDIVGIDNNGHQPIIVEAKFWAGLTDNQPSTYLNRLPSERPALLVFIAPEARFQTLWPELLRRCSSLASAEQLIEEEPKRCVSMGNGHRLALTSWRAVMRSIEARLVAAGEDAIRADLQQLAGLCERMDSEAFLPVRSEEMSPLVGRRINDYCSLIEDVVARLKQKGVCRTGKLRTSAAPGIWGRYILLRGNGCLLYWSATAWSRYREPPLWLQIKDHRWRNTAEIRTALFPLEREVPSRLIVDSEGLLVVPLFIPLMAERNTVIAELVEQICVIADLLPYHIADVSSCEPSESESGGSEGT